MNNIDFDAIDLTKEAPVTEPERQYYYIAKARKYVSEKAQEIGRYLTFCVTTFGCQMNARDSEKLVGVLELIGYKEEPDEEKADFVIYNTCTVRENANLRVYGRLGQLGAKKKKNPHMFIGLCGCMMQEPTVVEKIKKSYRFVDLIFGTHNIYKFAELIVTCFESERMVIDIWKDTDKIVEDLPSERKFSFKSGVNIMFGCNNFCSYCIVPYVRGRERSRKPEEIVAEIKRLVADGVVEIMLLGQNVNSYGNDREGEMNFASLLREINNIDGDFIIRFMTSHPKDCTHELLDTMAQCEKVAKHLHLPVQCGNDRVLKAMNRGYTAEKYLSLLEYARSVMPELSVTSDIIVGFPGETYEEFLDTVKLIEKAQYTSLYTFIFSPREGTRAAKMDDPVSREEKGKWFSELCAAQEKIAAARTSAMVGREYRVLCESKAKKDGYISGRTQGNIIIEFPADESVIGSFRTVRVTEALIWMLKGELAD